MRFFCVVCLFGIFIASLGCMTENWSSPLFHQPSGQQDGSGTSSGDFEIFPNRTMEREVFGTGDDSRAREIEGRLGFKNR